MEYVNEAGLVELGNAVVARACQDLREALVRRDDAIANLKRFFNSPHFNTFTTLDGEALLESLLNEDEATRKAHIRAYHRTH